MKRALIISFLLFTGPIGALPAAANDKLEALNSEIESRKNRQAELQAEAQDLQAQQKALQKRTIALARDLQNIDAERDRLEDRLAELAVSESQLDEALQNDRAALAK